MSEGESLKRKATEDNAELGKQLEIASIEANVVSPLERQEGKQVTVLTGNATGQRAGPSPAGATVDEVAVVEDWEMHPFRLLLKRACYK